MARRAAPNTAPDFTRAPERHSVSVCGTGTAAGDDNDAGAAATAVGECAVCCVLWDIARLCVAIKSLELLLNKPPLPPIDSDLGDRPLLSFDGVTRGIGASEPEYTLAKRDTAGDGRLR